MKPTQITFESPSGKSLVQRFNSISRYYAGLARNPDNSIDWIAAEMKKSLIANIERGMIIVKKDGKTAVA